MSFSHIRTLPTYDKFFKELQEFGYIKYGPTYHPGYKKYNRNPELLIIMQPTNDRAIIAL